MNPVPLAWKNLTNNLAKLALAVAGISFAVVLMFQQRGFNNALFDSTVAIIRSMDADLVVISRKKFTLSAEQRFDSRVLDVVRSQPHVESASPLYLEVARARFRTGNRRPMPVRAIAFNVAEPSPIGFVATGVGFQQLSKNGSVLVDRMSREEYLKQGKAELTGKAVQVVGQFSLGRDFAHDGNLLMSTETFKTIFPFRATDPTSIVDFALIKLDQRIEPQDWIKNFADRLPVEVEVLTRQEYEEREIQFWASNTPVGVIFGIGSVIGFLVGVFICYNVLASGIAEHLGEFATLKAMGYRNSYFLWLVFRQSCYLAILGFVPGVLISWGVFEVTSALTGLLMLLTVPRVAVIFLVTIVMCVLSGLLALRKLIAADPASLF